MSESTTRNEMPLHLIDNYPLWSGSSKSELSFSGSDCIETRFGIKEGDLVTIETNTEKGLFVYKGGGLFVSALEELENKRNKAVSNE